MAGEYDNDGKLYRGKFHTKPLREWRNYYYVNVQCLEAITPQKFMEENPGVLEALNESDRKTEAARKQADNIAALSEMIAKVGVERFQSALREAMTTQSAPMTMLAGDHQHTFSTGEKRTGDAAGHAHDVVNGECQDCMGHSHAMSTMKQAGAGTTSSGPA